MDNPINKLISKGEVENILNYFNLKSRIQINDLELYQRAFVHESYYQSVQNSIMQNAINQVDSNVYLNYMPKESNERLEYLGDHILKAIIGTYLYKRFHTEREGFLTKLKIKIEKCSMLHQFGVTLGFKKYLLLSLQVENQTLLGHDRGRGTPSFYEDAFEAFIGSIVLDLGYQHAERFVVSVIENVIDFAELISKNDNYKDSLQRVFQRSKNQPPVYSALTENGPLYRKIFTRMLVVTEEHYSTFDENIQNTIKRFTQDLLDYYKQHNPEAFMTLFNLYNEGKLVLGIGQAKKVVNAEQECAKQCMINLGVDLNF